MTTYRVFKRSATNWEEFAHNRKITVQRGLTLEEARALCKSYNDNRTPRQVKKGTMLEFTAEKDDE